jgi:hypothetical protein
MDACDNVLTPYCAKTAKRAVAIGGADKHSAERANGSNREGVGTGKI